MSEIIGAGLCRTGTSSTLVALEKLGIGPVYHMKEVITQNLLGHWIAFADGNKDAVFNQLKEVGYKSTLDVPIICFFEDLMEKYPDAKVLLTVRDSPAAWVKSFRATVFKMRDIPAWVGIARILGGPIGTIATLQQKIDINDFMFGTICQKGNLVTEKKITWSGNITDKELEQMYTNWTEYVRSKVPKEKLLEFNVKDGIEKLAKFTGKETPSWKMPNVNDSKEFNQRRQVVYVIAIVIYLLLGVAVYGFQKGCLKTACIPLIILLALRILSSVIGSYMIKTTLKNKAE